MEEIILWVVIVFLYLGRIPQSIGAIALSIGAWLNRVLICCLSFDRASSRSQHLKGITSFYFTTNLVDTSLYFQVQRDPAIRIRWRKGGTYLTFCYSCCIKRDNFLSVPPIFIEPLTKDNIWRKPCSFTTNLMIQPNTFRSIYLTCYYCCYMKKRVNIFSVAQILIEPRLEGNIWRKSHPAL